MDRIIPKKELQRQRYKQWGKIGSGVVLLLLTIQIILLFTRPSVSKKELIFTQAEEGTLETSIHANGKVIPAFEEVINSPISSRIIDAYCQLGDTVNEGSPLLKLDLQSTENAYQRIKDEEKMKQYNYEQFITESETQLSNMQMQLKVAELRLNRMAMELKNERYMDSIGAQTADGVRQAEMNYRIAQLEFEQQQLQYRNMQKTIEAETKVKRLDLNIFKKNVEEMTRKYENAQIRAPRKGTITMIKGQIGELVNEGSPIAILADLSAFKISGSISDQYATLLHPGGRVRIKNKEEITEGFITNIAPASIEGIITFEVELKNQSTELRAGNVLTVYIMNTIKEKCQRIKNYSFYKGEGDYPLFVKTADNKLQQRMVKLGESNYEYIEVISGIHPGEEVVVSDMSSYEKYKELALKP